MLLFLHQFNVIFFSQFYDTYNKYANNGIILQQSVHYSKPFFPPKTLSLCLPPLISSLLFSKTSKRFRLGKREHLTFTAREMLLDNPSNKLMWKNPDGVRKEAHVGRGAKVVY